MLLSPFRKRPTTVNDNLSLMRSQRMRNTTTNCLRALGQSIVVLALAGSAFSQFQAKPREKTGSPSGKIGMMFRRFIPTEPYDWRGAQTHALTTVIWYPAEPSAREQAVEIRGFNFFELGTAARNAKMPPSPARFPLLVISHGTGGSGLSMAWLGEALAKQGYIAAAVNHPGNNATQPYTGRRVFVALAARPRFERGSSLACWPTPSSAATLIRTASLPPDSPWVAIP
jgi:Platelet-activating factor acetylhydrolase, isoform II